MRFTELFTKTRRTAPKDETSKNAALLIRAGYLDKLMAGVYTYLPLGLRVLRNIEAVIREEMNKAGGQELLMPALHPKELWQKTGRWNSMDDLYKIIDSSNREFALSPTHEEVVAPLMRQFVSSYRDLPVAVYQFQTKFRMELRPKAGILRGREFLMKDLYSFHRDEADLKRYYEVMKKSYGEIWKRVGIGEATHLTYASGGSFSEFSHEFQTITPAGEDTVYLCEGCGTGVNKEIQPKQKTCPECGGKKFSEKRAIEVGNIFELKTKFSDAFGLTYKDEKGVARPVVMGCYGIGLGRVMGAIAETLSDEKGLVWPFSVAPFRAHLIGIMNNESGIREKTENVYAALCNAGIEVLYDDRDESAGVKFADADLLGMPQRIVISEKTVAKKSAELTDRATGKTRLAPLEKVAALL